MATAMTPANSPMYLPRSRGKRMSAIRTWLRAASPPPPSPWNPRNMMSISVCDSPAPALARMKIVSARIMRFLRFTRSASLPQIGVEIAVVSRVIVTTHV